MGIKAKQRCIQEPKYLTTVQISFLSYCRKRQIRRTQIQSRKVPTDCAYCFSNLLTAKLFSPTNLLHWVNHEAIIYSIHVTISSLYKQVYTYHLCLQHKTNAACYQGNFNTENQIMTGYERICSVPTCFQSFQLIYGTSVFGCV